jgi:hypothetical protein
MNALENYLDCQPINDNNIDNGKVPGNIMINENYNISSCATPNYNSYNANIFSKDDYKYNEINTPTTINGFAVLYAILIGLIMTLLIVSIFLKGVNYTGYKKTIVCAVIFAVCVSIVYGVCLYFLTSSNTRQIVKQDLANSQSNTNKIKS